MDDRHRLEPSTLNYIAEVSRKVSKDPNMPEVKLLEPVNETDSDLLLEGGERYRRGWVMRMPDGEENIVIIEHLDNGRVRVTRNYLSPGRLQLPGEVLPVRYPWAVESLEEALQ